MKLKGFEKLQHFYLDSIWNKLDEGKDVASALLNYVDMVESEGRSAETLTEDWHRRLREVPAVDPDNGQWRTWGFVPPFPGQPEDVYVANPLEIEGSYEQSLALEIHETKAILICVEKREKVLPASAINDKLFERAEQMKQREERDLTRKDYAVLKEEVTAALLKTAPVRRTRINVIFHGRDLYVFTASAKAAEEVTATIRRTFSSLPTIPAYTAETKLRLFFKNVMQGKIEPKDSITTAMYAKLKNFETGEVVTVKDGYLDEDRYTDLLDEHFEPIELEFRVLTQMTGLEFVWAKMSHKGDVKAMSTTAEVEGEEFETQYERGESGFQSKMAELWVWLKVINEFSAAMAKTGSMTERDKLDEYEDGDDAQVEKDSKAKAAPKAPQAADAGEDTEEDDDGWDTEEDDDDGDI